MQCPICRTELKIDEVHFDVREPSVENPWREAKPSSLTQILSQQELHFVKDYQQRWKERFQKQENRGSFFNESPFVLSLTTNTNDWIVDASDETSTPVFR